MTDPHAPPVSPDAAEGRAAPALKKTERPHPLTPLVRGWVVLAAIAVGAGRELVQNSAEHPGDGIPGMPWILLGLVAIVLLAGVSGFATWYFTRYVIDAEELRIETGVLTKKSRRVAFQRLQSVDLVQPLLARLLGLAELRLEVGGGDSHVQLRYLRRDEAARLRDYLLARAHGETADPTAVSTADRITDDSRTDEVLVRIDAGLIIAGFLVSTEALVFVLGTVALIVVGAVFDIYLYLLSAIVPMAIGAFQLVAARVFAQFNYTLARAPRGLRITRGLTNLTSQSIPVDRIQGLRITQPMLWRPFGWYRIHVDVLGYGGGGDGDGQGGGDRAASSLMLPVARRAQMETALAAALPGLRLDGIPRHRLPRSARVVDPIRASFVHYGFNDDLIEQHYGALRRVREIVPHGKTQSVRIQQGPLQRALGLASVQVHTTKGPVDLQIGHVSQTQARALAFGQLERARTARRRAGETPGIAGLPGGASPQGADPGPQPGEREVLVAFGIEASALLGSGGESRVFALPDGDHVLRLMHPGHHHEAGDPSLEQLYRMWADSGVVAPDRFPALLPQVVDHGRIGDRRYTVDRRMPGADLMSYLRGPVSSGERRAALLGYLDVAMNLWQLPLPTQGFARLAGPDARAFRSLLELCDYQIRLGLETSYDALAVRVPDLDARIHEVLEAIGRRSVTPMLVHGDYCPSNVLVERGPRGPRVTGVVDFSSHTLAADPVMDVAGAVAFLTLQAYPGCGDDARWLEGVATRHLGQDAPWLDVYRRYFALYYAMDPAVWEWSARQLSRPAAT